MATLTEAETRAIRQRIGDLKPSTLSKTDLTDEDIQEEWDRANGHSGTTAYYLAHYYMLERRWGLWINATDTETAQGSKSQSQKVAQIEKLMNFYAEKAGVSDFIMPTRAGTMDFGLDQDDPITGEDLDA